MTNHPNRRQIRLSITPEELQALADLVLFAQTSGYHPMSKEAQNVNPNSATLRLVVKIYATMRGIVG